MKKTFIRMVSCLLVLCLVLSVPLCGSSVAAEEEIRYGESILAQMENANALRYAYQRIVAGVAAAEAKIDLQHRTYTVTGDELSIVYDMVFRDYPEYFWLKGGWSGSTMNGYVISIAPGYHMTGATLETAQAALEQQVAALTADLEGKSDYEKSLLLHNRVADATVYVQQGYHQTAYGALVQGAAVCAGYARAYQLLMQRAGIPAWYVTGSSINPGTGMPENHGWNLVQLDGEWYYTDVTWDDQPSYTFYAYLNTTTDQITEDHVFGEYAAYLPKATATEHNYFVRNDLVMRKADDDDLADVIRNYSPARVYVDGDVSKFVADYYDEIRDIAKDLDVPSGAAFSYGYSNLGREVILRLTVSHTCRYETITVPATCLEDGYTVEECNYAFCHNQQNKVVLPAAGAHVYDNACDAECNACGSLRETEAHQYDNDRDADCNLCGALRELPEDLPGDADDDGDLSIHDALILQQYVNGWDVSVYDAAADMNHDEKLNNKDLVLLLRRLNGWDTP